MKDDRDRRDIIFPKKRNTGQISGDIPESVNEEKYILAWAAMLARKGNLQQAEALLQPMANRPEASINVIDLLAKVYAQQMKIEAARSLWLKAIQLDPNNTHFYRALLHCTNLINDARNV